MLRTTVGQLLVNNALPADMRRYDRVLDKKGISELYQELAERYPDEYRNVAKRLSDIGRHAASATGGYSFGVRHLRSSLAAKRATAEIANKLQAVYADPAISDDERSAKILSTVQAYQKSLPEEVFAEAVRNNNPLARQVVSGSRGNKNNLNSLLGADLLYEDHTGQALPLPVLRSYSQGLRPFEFFAGAFGARKGLHDIKCLDGDTLVRMADYSVKKIRDIRVGDRVMGADRAGHMRPVHVTEFHANGPRKCFRWVFRVGEARKRFVELVATEEHKVLAQIKAGRPGSTYGYRSVYTPTPLPLTQGRVQKRRRNITYVAFPARGGHNACGVNEPRALLLGLLLGDGTMMRKQPEYNCHALSLSCGDPTLLADIKDYLRSLNLEARPPKVGYSHNLAEIVRSPQLRGEAGARYAGTGNPIRQWLASLGVTNKYSHEKHIPEVVWTWDDVSIASLICGLIATDGGIDWRKQRIAIAFCCTSRQMVETLRELLEVRFGVWCSAIGTVPGETQSMGIRDQYRFTIGHRESIKRFHARISLVGVKSGVMRDNVPHITKSQPHREELGFKLYDKQPLGLRETFDIGVDNADHLFVLANGLIVSNSSTAKAGFFGKQLIQAAHRLLVTAKDDDTPYDESTPRGFPVDTDDPDNAGALLAHPVGKYKRNTVLTPAILKELRDAGQETLLVRSPVVGGPKDGGVYGYDVGVRERGGIAPRGDFVGIAAAQSLSEPLAQSMLSSKHSGGVAGASAGAIGGFKPINQLVQTPKVFQGGATHAQLDGTVRAVREAPQGGHYVTVGSEEHYVRQGLPVLVKPGDEVEAGDPLSEGQWNPAEITRHKHIGEGRRAFTRLFHSAFKNSGITSHRRNVELLARGLINHVRLTAEVGPHVPDDIVPYQTIEAAWQPRAGAVTDTPKRSLGRYLERPVLHYTIGTKVRPSVLKELARYNVGHITTHTAPPPFEPEMVRGMANITHDPDPFTRMLGSYQQSSMLDAVHRGATSDEAGSSYVPAMARRVDFGRTGLTKGWEPGKP